MRMHRSEQKAYNATIQGNGEDISDLTKFLGREYSVDTVLAFVRDRVGKSLQQVEREKRFRTKPLPMNGGFSETSPIEEVAQ